MELSHKKGQHKEKRIFKKWSKLRAFWNNIKQNICIIGPSEREEIKKGAENLCEEMMVENFPNLGREADEVQEAQRVPN